MTDTVTFQSPPTGTEAPAAPAPKPATASGDRPAWLPENFATPEDFAKSFADTKAELTRVQQELAKLKKPAEQSVEKPAEKPGDKTAEGKNLEIDEQTKDELEKAAGIDFAPYQQEFVETGDVSQESRAKIAESLKSIFGDDAPGIVNDYIEGAKNRLANTTSQLKAIAGGDEGYAAMVNWAKDNLSPEEKAAFNRQVNSGDFHAASFAVQGLKMKYDGAVGRAPRLINGDGPATPAAPFRSLHDLKQAIADPRYKTDPDYRAAVEKRAALSNI